MDGLARKLEVDRHRDEARAHDAVVGGEIFGAIGGENRDAIAAHKPAPHKRAGDAVRHGIKLRVAELARTCLAAEVDDGDLAQIAIAADQVAEIDEGSHRQRPSL